jgi:NAD(P)-dependent dehydrogenase (short-subunit alcohol dehydrogenase family)
MDVARDDGATVIPLGRSGTEMSVDIRNADSVEAFVANLSVDRLDILINNAGVFPDPDVGIRDLDLVATLDVLNVNAVGSLRVTQACLPLLKRSPNPRILNISSAMGSLSKKQGPGSYGYRMSKSALNMFTVALATEFPEIRVLSVHPGHVRTLMGGPNAPVQPIDSAKGIWQLATDPPHEGHFFDYLGNSLAW